MSGVLEWLKEGKPATESEVAGLGWDSDINLTELSSDEKLVISLYARVSTTKDAQVDAVKYQESVLRNWLENQIEKHPNWKMGNTYVDTKTGRNFKREAYKRMMLDAQTGKMNYIVFWETSRFGRNLSAVLRECIRLNDKHGINLYFVDKQIDTRLPDGLGRLSEEAKIADEYSKNTRSKVIRGINEKKRIYESMGDGYLFTHRILGLESRKGIKQKLFRVEDEVETLNLMAQFYLEENSLRKTAERLMEAGRLTVTGGTYWDTSSITRYLHNPLYICVEEQNKTKIATLQNYYENSRTNYRKEEHTYAYMPDRIERIWSDEYFALIQRALEKNGKLWINGRDRKDGRPIEWDVFSQIFWCECGGKMGINSRRLAFGKGYYECHHKKHRGSKRVVGTQGGEVCESKNIYSWKMWMMFDEIVRVLGVNFQESVQNSISIINECDGGNKEEITNMIVEIDKKIVKLEGQMQKHRNRMLRELITEAEYKADISDMKNEIELLNKDKQELLDMNSETVIDLSVLGEALGELSGAGNKVSNEFVYGFVDMVVQVSDNVFYWYLNTGLREDREIPEQYQIVHKKRLPLKEVEVIKDSRRLIAEFTVNEAMARTYKKKHELGSLRQYQNLIVKVLV